MYYPIIKFPQKLDEVLNKKFGLQDVVSFIKENELSQINDSYLKNLILEYPFDDSIKKRNPSLENEIFIKEVDLLLKKYFPSIQTTTEYIDREIKKYSEKKRELIFTIPPLIWLITIIGTIQAINGVSICVVFFAISLIYFGLKLNLYFKYKSDISQLKKDKAFLLEKKEDYEDYRKNQYKNQLENKEILISRLQNSSLIRDYMKKIKAINIKNYFKNSAHFAYSDNTNIRGRHEEKFDAFLRQIFGGNILNNVCVNGKYYPDLVYFNSEYNIKIDIEIDEPYDFERHYPIHVMGTDNNRDEYFLQSGWIVLRFTEYQVAKYPYACAYKIYEIIKKINNGGASIPIKFAYLNEIETDNLTEKAWTFEEANDMAFRKFRNSY